MTLQASLSPVGQSSYKLHKIKRAAEQTEQDDQERRRIEAIERGLIRAYGGDGADLETCKARYKDAIKAAGNPADQIRNFTRAGVIFQPKQLQMASWARRADSVEIMPAYDADGENLGSPEIGMGGAKGGGKSYALFTIAAVDDCQREAGIKVLYLRKVGKKANEQLQDLVKSALQFIDHSLTREMVKFPNGSQITVGHFLNEKDAINYAGLEYDVIILEEATQLTFKAYRALRGSARSSKTFRPRLYNSTNPLGVGHTWYKKRFIDPERKEQVERNRGNDPAPRNRKFIAATIDDNQFVNEDYIGNLETYTGAELRAYRYGDWDVLAGAYFGTFRRDVHVKPSMVGAVPSGWEAWMSMDYGFNHYNMTYLHLKDADGNRYTVYELAHRFRTPQQIAPDIHAMLGRFGLTRRNLTRFVAGGDIFNRTGADVMTIAQKFANLGLPVQPAQTGAGSRVAGAHEVARLLGDPDRAAKAKTPEDAAPFMPRWFITEDCPRLIECLPVLERNPNNSEDVLKWDMNEDGTGGDDPYDAARYGLYMPSGGTISNAARRAKERKNENR